MARKSQSSLDDLPHLEGVAATDPMAVKPGFEDCVQNLRGRWLRHVEYCLRPDRASRLSELKKYLLTSKWNLSRI